MCDIEVTAPYYNTSYGLAWLFPSVLSQSISMTEIHEFIQWILELCYLNVAGRPAMLHKQVVD